MVQSENKLSVYAGPPMWRVLEQAGSENRSSRINAVCERYDAIVRDELTRIAFSRNEWCAIVDTENGTYMGDMGWQSTWANVMDNPELDAKWNVSHKELGWRLHHLPLAARAAVVEVVERYWSSPNLNKRKTRKTHDELLREAGAVFPDTEESAMYRLILLAALLPATAHAQQPWGRVYTPPAPPPPAWVRGQPYMVPTLPPGSPSLMIPNPPAPPYQPQPWTGARP